MKKAISHIYNKLSLDIIINLILVLFLIFSKNFLEEDLILGFFSSLTLLFIFFIFKESKREDLREFRLNIKKIYRIQKKLLKEYYFYYGLIQKRYSKYTKKILKKIFHLKLRKSFLNSNLKLKTFFFRLILIKLLNQAFLINLILKNNIKIIGSC